MYFQNHNQLIEVLNTLEEKNLFLIQMKQEDESNLDEFKHRFKQEKTVFIFLYDFSTNNVYKRIY